MGFLKKITRSVTKAAGAITGANFLGSTALGVAGDLAGGIYSAKANQRAIEHSERFQREMAQHGIRWRVADAKAAGLHPLYALGAQIPAANPIVLEDPIGPALSAAGQNISRAVAAVQTAPEKAAQALALRTAQSQLAESDARTEMYRSEAARNWREANRAETFPVDDLSGIPGQHSPFFNPEAAFMPSNPQAVAGIVEKVPSQEQTSAPGKNYVGAAQGPGWDRFFLGNHKVWWPNQRIAESLEDNPTLLINMAYEKTLREEGAAAAAEFLREFGGAVGGSFRREAVEKWRQLEDWANRNWAAR